MRYATEWRILSALYFTVAGTILIDGLSLTAPRAWYSAFAWLFLGCAIAWAWRPAVAAVLSIVPILGLAGLFGYCHSAGDVLFLAGVLGIAVFFVARTFWSSGFHKPAS